MLETTKAASTTQTEQPIDLTDNARVVLMKRYVRRGPDGKPNESVEGMFRRVARAVAEPDREYGIDVQATEDAFYRLLTELCFFPNSPTFTGAGTPLGQLAACFVLPISDDMGRDSAGIFQTLRDAALIQQTGGGNGFSFGCLRPKGTYVASSAGQATGPVGFLRVYDKAFGEIAQGGTRRGANMAVLPVHHPDVMDFINCKISEDQITNFNISVGITDQFMAAVRDDADFELIDPHNGCVMKTVRAKEIFNAIVKNAYRNGEPGVLFLDAANRTNPVPHLYELEATNPCVTGETLIYTANGLHRADELAASAQAGPIVVDGRFGTEVHLPSTAVFSTGVKDVVRLLTHEGYEVRLTSDHQVMTSRGWVAAGQLQPGDHVHILNRPGGFGANGSLEAGRVLGWLVGDGTITAVRAVLSFFGEEKQELAPLFAQSVTQLVEREDQLRPYPVGITQVAERDEARVASERLKSWAAEFGLTTTADKLQVPVGVLAGNKEMQRGFLQALFTADGYVNDGGEKGCSVRLSSSHLPLLKDVQRLLLNFGIASHIYEDRRTGGFRPMPDGKGGKKEYFHKPQHELSIGKTNLIAFTDHIGFLTDAKQVKVAAYLSRMQRGPYAESFLATVKTVEPDGREMVYDLQQPHTHSFIANGLVVHNCGEQWLGPYENCCLGSINLAQHVKHVDGETQVDWQKLQESIVLSTRFLDNVVTANKYVPAVPQLKEAANRARRIGLGIMGLGDLMYHLGIRYGSETAQEFASQVLEFVRFHCMKTSVQLAKDRGAFPAIEGSLYDPKNLKWSPPQPLVAYRHDWGRPPIDWEEIVKGIKQYGIRNAAQTTVAPTGTIATVAGCEAYGCEPVFALAYMRHVVDAEASGKDGRTTLTYASPLFEQALIKAGVDETTRRRIYEEVMTHGTCQDVKDVPEPVRHAFVVSADITPDEHVRMQAAIQAFVDNSISKTCNFPENAKEEDVAKAYFLAWELGCKGLTVYVTGSREKVVLETKATAQKKEEKKDDKPMPAPEPAHTLREAHKKPRPRKLRGETYRIGTPLGTAFITINVNGGDQPFEVFLNVGKAGSDTAAVAEAMGRLISLVLRLPSPMSPTERLKIVTEQLTGIGGGRSLGFGPNRVRSLPDGISQALAEYLSGIDPSMVINGNGQGGDGHNATTDTVVRPASGSSSLKIGDLCPECGEATYVNEEGCRKCYSCGHSEC